MALNSTRTGTLQQTLSRNLLWIIAWSISVSAAFYPLQAAEPPHIKMENGTGQLIVNGQPFLILGGELGNSSAGTAAEADLIIPKAAAMHVNTVLMPVAWEQIEPKEGAFDFSILDHWIDTAREHNLHLVPLWFASWKNAFSNYVPAWVKADPKRFPRAQSADGRPLEILSTLSAETRRSDSRAFAALMRHIREKDSDRQTVLMVQVENEVGYLGQGGRDRSPEANRLFSERVPDALVRHLTAKRLQLSPELAEHFNDHGQTWSQMFGEAANEVFMAWNYANYIEAVAHAGKTQYALPMYVNAQLPAPLERAGEYPSGGAHPHYLEVWRAAAPSIDFYSPDIYWPDLQYWVQRYQIPGNAIFIPEARMEPAPFNALYAYGQARAFGFSPFAIDSLTLPKGEDPKPGIMAIYELLDSIHDMLPTAQFAGRTRGLVLHTTSLRPTQTVALGGYLFEATLSRSWPARAIVADDGAMLILQASPEEFYIIGSGLTISITRDPDVDTKVAGIESVEQVSRSSGQWITERRLNGDQTNQGRQVLLDPHRPHIYRVRLYSFAREGER